jgi:hypothetical protein
VIFLSALAVATAAVLGLTVAAAFEPVVLLSPELPQAAVNIIIAEATKTTPSDFLDFICFFLPYFT